jgi:hypothetical protein
MRSVEEIKTDIEALPHREYIKLARWFAERDWEAWDDQLAQDAEAGKLDFLIEEARAEGRSGKLHEL